MPCHTSGMPAWHGGMPCWHAILVAWRHGMACWHDDSIRVGLRIHDSDMTASDGIYIGMVVWHAELGYILPCICMHATCYPFHPFLHSIRHATACMLHVALFTLFCHVYAWCMLHTRCMLHVTLFFLEKNWDFYHKKLSILKLLFVLFFSSVLPTKLLTQNRSKKYIFFNAIPLRKTKQIKRSKIDKNLHTKHHQIDQNTWFLCTFVTILWTF